MSRIRFPVHLPRSKEMVLGNTLRVFIGQYRRGEIDKTELNNRVIQALEKHYEQISEDVNRYFISRGYSIVDSQPATLKEAKEDWRRILADL